MFPLSNAWRQFRGSERHFHEAEPRFLHARRDANACSRPVSTERDKEEERKKKGIEAEPVKSLRAGNRASRACSFFSTTVSLGGNLEWKKERNGRESRVRRSNGHVLSARLNNSPVCKASTMQRWSGSLVGKCRCKRS